MYLPKRFFAGSLGADGNNTLYTVPAGKRVIVTHWEVTPTSTISGFDFYTAPFVIAHGGCLGHNVDPPEGGVYQAKGFYVSYAGEHLLYTVKNSEFGAAWQNVHGLEGDASDLFEGGEPIRIIHKATTNSEVNAYTVPAGKTLILKTLVMVNISGIAGKAAARIGAAPITGWFHPLGPSGSQENSVQLDGPWIAYAGEAVTFNWDQNVDGCSFSAYGVLV